MSFALLVAFGCYLFAGLFARGWLVHESYSWALALLAFGLLAQLVASFPAIPIHRAPAPPRE